MQTLSNKTIILVAVLLNNSWRAFAAEPGAIISPATTDEHGFLVHDVESPYQAGKTQIRVLLPNRLNAGQTYPVIYVLPVEAKNESRFGDGLIEVKKHDLHNKHQVVFVAPTFSHLPWYADHPTNPLIRQESYLLQVVVASVESNYFVAKQAHGRLLLGFSKSGWGAWSLLLRQPNRFGRAAAWDAPLMMNQLGMYGTTQIFDSQQNFEKYRIKDLLQNQANALGTDKRLILTGVGNFGEHHEQIHSLMLQLKIQHIYRDMPPRNHDWHSGWVPEAVELLMAQE